MISKKLVLIGGFIPAFLTSSLVYLLSGTNLGVLQQQDEKDQGKDEGKEDSSKDNPDVITYRKKIWSEGILWIVDPATTIERMQGIILQDQNFLDYTTRKLYDKDVLFPGSPELNFKTKVHTTEDGKEVLLLDMEEEAKALKDACLEKLDKPEGDLKEKLTKWCVCPTIKDMASRKGFTLTGAEEDHLITNGWIAGENGDLSEYAKKHKFIKESDFVGKSNFQKKFWMTLECSSHYKRAFSITNLPTLDLTKMDIFQQVTLFCSPPMSVKNYLSAQYEINDFEPITDKDKKDYFYEKDKDDLKYYQDIKTSDPMNGKSFWGAARFLYSKRKKA